jgi:glucose-6-phosphate isomerase
MEIKLKKNPDIRTLSQMKETLCDQKWAKNAPDFELYYMHRTIKEKGKLDYDVTVIPARMLGQEFVKTKGHEHCDDYGEIYRVIEGEGTFLFQKRNKEKITDVYSVKAKKGESVIIPPKYGHVTINRSKRKLMMANWPTGDSRKSDYGLFVKKHGACYYCTKSGWIKNKNYKQVPKLRFKKPLAKFPKNLDFLYEKS